MSRFPDSVHGSIIFLLVLVALLTLPLYFSKQQYKATASDGVVATQDDKGAKAPTADTGKGVALTMTPSPTPVYTSEQDEIVAYIHQIFKEQGDNAVKIAQCESRLNPLAVGHNTNGSTDTGIFQVNSIHGVAGYFLTNWRTNVDVAYTIYQRNGWNAWVCATKWEALN